MVEKQANKQARYGLRKLNIGVASILLGLSFLGVGSISADELNNTTEANVENVEPTEDKSINEHKIRECKNVKRTINFFQDGKLIDSITQSADFYRYNIWNLGTNELIASTQWRDTTTHRIENYFDAVDVPEIAGYTADQTKIENTTVTGDSADQVINVNYTATTEEQTEQKTVKRVIRLAKDGVVFKEIPQEFTFTRTNIVDKQTGQIIQTGTWNQAEHTFAAVDIEQLENYTASQDRVEALTVDPESPDSVVDINYTSAQKVEDEFKTVERLIEIYHEGVKVDVFTQKVEFKRTKTTNLATGEVTYGAWNQAEGLWSAFDAPVYDNYETDTIKVNNKTVTPDTANETARIDYTAKRENLTEEKVVKRVINIYKDGQKVDQHVQSVTFKRTNIKNLATGEITYGEWDEPSKMLDDYRGPEFENYDSPSNRYVPRTAVSATTEDLEVNMYYTAKVATSIEQKTVVRTIQLHFPDGTFKKVTQQVTFKREVKTNLATGEKEYGAWDMDKNTLPEYKVDQVENYEPSQSVVEAVVITPETETLTVDIYYNAKTATEVEEKVALRQILLHLPDGTVKEVTQQVMFKREIKTNLATGEKEYGAWDIEEGTLPEYQVEQVENYEPSQSVVEAMKVTPETAGNWTVDIYYNAKTTTRTEYYTAKRVISLVKDGKKVDEITQSVLFKREVTKNLATGEETFSDWSTDNDSWEAFVAPSFENYVANIPQLEAVKVDPNTKDTEVTINYTAATKEVQETRTVKRVINIYRDGKKVDEITQRVVFTRTNIVNLATGEITYGAWNEDQKHFAEYEVPEVYGYEPEEKIISAMAVDPEMQDTTANVNYKSIVTTEIEEKVVDRKIILNLPNGMTREHIQSVTFKREVYKNLATGEMTYGAWDIPQAMFEAYQVPGFSGYVASVKHIEALEVTADSESTTVVVDYYQQSKEEKDVFRIFNIQVIDGVLPRGKQQYTQKVTFTRDVYLDANGKVVGHGDWEQTELMFEDFEIPQREGYATFRSVIAGQKVTVDSADLESEITYVAHANDTETKEVKRKVTIILPNGSKHEEIQTVTFVRDKVTNQISGKTSYGNWLPATENSEFPEMVLPDIAGYKPSQTVDRLDVTSDMANIEVTVTYERDGDARETTPDAPGNGEVTPDVPGNGETTPDAPDAGETTPDVPGNGEATPDIPDAGETTPDVPGNGEAILDTLDAGETMPDTPGDGEVTPDTPDAGETTPDTPENDETPSGTPEAGADSDSDDTDQSDLGMKPEIGPGQNSPSKMKNNGSGAKVPNMANSSADKATKSNAAAGTELPNLGDETVRLKGLGALLAAMACASLFMSATAKKRKN